jgi:hypothetical protein
MRSIVLYAAVVLAALISCTSAEAKRHHHGSGRAVHKTATIKHSTSTHHYRGGKHYRHAARVTCHKCRGTRHHSISHTAWGEVFRDRWGMINIQHGPYHQLVLRDGTLTGPIAPDANGG